MKQLSLILLLLIPIISFCNESFIVGYWKVISEPIKVYPKGDARNKDDTVYIRFFEDKSYQINTVILKPVILKGKWEYKEPDLTLWDSDGKNKTFKVIHISKDNFRILDKEDNLQMTFYREEEG